MTIPYPYSFVQAAQRPLEEMLQFLEPGSWRKVRTLSDAIHGTVKLVEGFLPDQPKTFVVKQIPITAMEAANCIECPRNEIYASLAISQELRMSIAAEVLFAAKDEKFYYLASEHCPNGELFSVIKRAGCLEDSALTREIIRDILTGVADLHRAGIAHRDLSLENVLVAADGNLRLIDFAQAVVVHAPGDHRAASEARISQDHGPPGKPQYRGPELGTGGPYLATKVDTFAVGIMLYVLVVGAYPFIPAESCLKDASRIDLFPLEEAALGRCSRLRLQLQKEHTEVMDRISPSCMDMMEKLLAPNPELRLSAEEALAHPWLTSAADEDHMEDASTDCAGDADTMTDWSDGPVE